MPAMNMLILQSFVGAYESRAVRTDDYSCGGINNYSIVGIIKMTRVRVAPVYIQNKQSRKVRDNNVC